jgi:hypothetical protein
MSNDSLPYLTSEDLMLLFGYKTMRCFYNAVRNGKFPVPTYKIGRWIVADKEVVRQFFADQRQRGLAEIQRRRARNADTEWDDLTD